RRLRKPLRKLATPALCRTQTREPGSGRAKAAPIVGRDQSKNKNQLRIEAHKRSHSSWRLLHERAKTVFYGAAVERPKLAFTARNAPGAIKGHQALRQGGDSDEHIGQCALAARRGDLLNKL